MAAVFIANPTLLNRNFHYRMPEQRTVKLLKIRAGGQAQLPGDFSPEQLGLIVQQIQNAGGVPHNDAKAITTPFCLLYRVENKPITADAIDQARERDREARQEMAAGSIEQVGVATLQNAENALKMSGQDPSGVASASLEVEQLQDDEREVKDTKGVDVEIVVSRNTGNASRTAKKDNPRRRSGR